MKRLLKTVALVTLLVVGGKVFGFAKEMLAASLFGTHGIMDAYLLSLSLPFLTASAMVGALSSTVVPVVQEYDLRDGQDAGQQALSAVFWQVGAIALATAAVVIMGAPWVIDLLAHGLTPDLRALAIQFTRLNGTLIVILCLTYTYQGAFHARNRFYLTAGIQVLAPVTNILTLWGLHGHLGAWVLPLGMVLGTVAVLVGFVVLYRTVLRQKIQLLWRHAAATRVLRLSAALLMAQSVLSVNDMIDQWMAVSLAAGSVSSLSYAQKLIDIPVQLCVVGISSVVLPLFGEQWVRRNVQEMSDLFLRVTSLAFFVTLPLVVGFALMARPLVTVAFQRGAFTAQSTGMVSPAVLAYAVSLPFVLGGFLNARLLNAVQDVRPLTVVALITLPLNILLDWVFMMPWGYVGIAWSTTCMRFVSYICVLWVIARRYVRVKATTLLWDLLRQGVAALIMGLVVYFLDLYAFTHLLPLLRLILAGICGLVVYLVAALFLRCPEAADMVAFVRKKTSLGGRKAGLEN